MPTYRWLTRHTLPAVTKALSQRDWSEGASAAVLLSAQKALEPEAPANVIWLTPSKPTRAQLTHALTHGAYDVVDVSARDWEKRLLARMQELLSAEPELVVPENFIAESSSAKLLLKRLHQASQTSMPVLLTGETGTGKEVSARVIHQMSSRKNKTLVPINCAAIPDELMEGELFGYTKGSFSGAVRDYDGLVMAAEGGTVFLDEIDDTPHALQTKLLRVLEDHVVSRLGESEWHAVNFRLIAATNRNLLPMIEQGLFGADLYERLATVLIELPPLRERLEDLAPLTRQLIERYYADDAMASKRHRVRQVSDDALSILWGYHWPGNIRELRNVISGALVAKRAGDTLLASDLPRRLWAPAKKQGDRVVNASDLEARMAAGTMNLAAEIEALERTALTVALRRARGNASEAARLLGQVGRGAAKNPGDTVRVMMRRLGVSAE